MSLRCKMFHKSREPSAPFSADMVGFCVVMAVHLARLASRRGEAALDLSTPHVCACRGKVPEQAV